MAWLLLCFMFFSCAVAAPPVAAPDQAVSPTPMDPESTPVTAALTTEPEPSPLPPPAEPIPPPAPPVSAADTPRTVDAPGPPAVALPSAPPVSAAPLPIDLPVPVAVIPLAASAAPFSVMSFSPSSEASPPVTPVPPLITSKPSPPAAPQSTDPASIPAAPPAASSSEVSSMSFSAAALSFSISSPSEQQALDIYYQGNVERSIREFEQILRLEPGNIPVRWELIRTYYETGEGIRATAVLENLYQEKPADPEVERELFLTLCLTGNYQKALAMLPLSRETGETLFYQALIRRDTGDPRQAVELLRKSLASENFRPIGWFVLGELLAETAPTEAETCFRTALRQDPELRNVYFPLGSVLLAQKQYKEAYTYLNRANQSFPNNNLILRSLNEAARSIPESERSPRPPGAVAERPRITAAPPKVKPLNQAGLTMVRIGLAEKQTLITVKTGGPYILRGSSRAVLFSGDESEQLWIEIRNSQILIQDQQRRNLVIADKSVTLDYPNTENTTILSGFTSEDRAYRGSLEFRLDQGTLTIINILNIEEYLYGVIPAEMPASWPMEALKAQAIAARSYTMAYLGQHKEKGFDLYGSVLSAAYRGVTGEARASTAAVDATKGMYLRAGGQPLKSYYSANHGGYSENTAFVWGTDTFNPAVPDKLIPLRTVWLPLNDLARWIREKPKSYDSAANLHSSQAYRWEKWVAAEDIRSRNAEFGSIGEILQIISRGRGISGRTNEVEIKGSQGSMRIKGDHIRSRLGGLRSNLFTIRSKLGKDGKPEYFIFQGAGWGHGVGLDQSGAAGMAQAGFTAAQILGHYYPLAELAGN